jgi:hypothetical protein
MSYNNPPGGVYTPGLNHVGAYQVSGHPFCKHINDCSQNVVPVFFDKVTQWIQIVNHEQSELYVAFHEDQLSWDSQNGIVAGTNHFKIHAVHSGGSKEGAFPQILPLKTDRIYLIMDTGSSDALADGVDVVAGLTNIPASRMYELTGPGINE